MRPGSRTLEAPRGNRYAPARGMRLMMVRCPPLWPDHENFLQATLYEKVRFLQFSSKFQKKMSEFAASIGRSKAKSVSASGGLRPPDQWLCPWTPLEADPRYRVALCALAMAPLCQILNTPLYGEGCPLPTWVGEGFCGRLSPILRKFSDFFLCENDVLWCIFGTILSN